MFTIEDVQNIANAVLTEYNNHKMQELAGKLQFADDLFELKQISGKAIGATEVMVNLMAELKSREAENDA